MLLYPQTDAKPEQERLKCYIRMFLWGTGEIARVRVIRSVSDHVRTGRPPCTSRIVVLTKMNDNGRE
jgi:hypothetical protein